MSKYWQHSESADVPRSVHPLWRQYTAQPHLGVTIIFKLLGHTGTLDGGVSTLLFKL